MEISQPVIAIKAIGFIKSLYKVKEQAPRKVDVGSPMKAQIILLEKYAAGVSDICVGE